EIRPVRKRPVLLLSILWLSACNAAPAATTPAANFTITPLGTTNAHSSHYVALVPPAMTSPFHVSLTDGAKAEGVKLGWRVDAQAAASENDIQAQVTIVQQLIEMGTEAISINTLDDNAIVQTVKTANARHVLIFIHNSLTPLPGGDVTAYIGYDQWRGAAKLGIYTCQLLAKKYNTAVPDAHGKVFILLGIDGFHTHRRTQGYIAGLAQCPGVQIVGKQTAEWDRAEGANVATAALQQTPDIDVFYGNSDEMGIGAALAAEKLGMKINQDFFAVSIDGNQPTLDLIKEGKYTATLGVDPTRMGQTVIDTMNDVMSGKKVPPYLLTPSVVVDASNLDDYEAGKIWSAPTAGLPEEDNGLPSG
ncbi:MAG TPA: sugar ABC transporter substrate-binding protein, partial [Aggregatilineales bacterium]|nr:sugar ABC transporter substrate-binding protein [Aggregatilineales bacterium]